MKRFALSLIVTLAIAYALVSSGGCSVATESTGCALCECVGCCPCETGGDCCGPSLTAARSADEACHCPCRRYVNDDGGSCRLVDPCEARAAAAIAIDQATGSSSDDPCDSERGVCEGSDPLPPAPPWFDDEPAPRPLEDLPLDSWPQAGYFDSTSARGPPVDVEAPSGLECPDPLLAGDVPRDVREWYRNKTMPGSCVQCSIGICGCSTNVPNASLLLWNSDYGRAELHGSHPYRVAEYARKRSLRIWNVTGAENTYDYLRWACRTGRPAAISCNQSHFQTLLGHDPQTNRWFVVDNNSPERIDVYDDAEFRRRHEAMGSDSAWCVILDYPPTAPRPEYVAWWN